LEEDVVKLLLVAVITGIIIASCRGTSMLPLVEWSSIPNVFNRFDA